MENNELKKLKLIIRSFMIIMRKKNLLKQKLVNKFTLKASNKFTNIHTVRIRISVSIKISFHQTQKKGKIKHF